MDKFLLKESFRKYVISFVEKNKIKRVCNFYEITVTEPGLENDINNRYRRNFVGFCATKNHLIY